MITSATAAVRGTAQKHLRSYNILLAEDDMITANAIIRFLEEFNMNVTHARDGEEALQFCKVESYDLIISDFEMPKKSGLEMLRQIKADLPSQKIIFLTAYSRKDILSDALRNGADAYYLKPIDLTRLMNETLSILQVNADRLISRAHFPLRIEQGKSQLAHTAIDFSGCPGNVRLIDMIIGRLPNRTTDRSIISLRFDEKFGIHKDALQLIANLVEDLVSLLHVEPADIDLGGEFFRDLHLNRSNAPGRLSQCRIMRDNAM